MLLHQTLPALLLYMMNFHLHNVEEVLNRVISFGGSKVGEIAVKEFKSGILTFTYAADPEGNIIELTNWEAK